MRNPTTTDLEPNHNSFLPIGLDAYGQQRRVRRLKLRQKQVDKP